jgi:hypothetical protein
MSEKTIDEYRSDLEKVLSKTKENEICIPYSNVSLAFPGGPHPRSFDIEIIDSASIKKWANNLGWHTELTTNTQQDFPDVRFMRINQEARPN